MIAISQAASEEDRQLARSAFWDYLMWANARINQEFGVNFDIAAMLETDMRELGKFLPPGGRLLIARMDGALAGVACLKRLEEEVGEIKRMYVVPACRGKGIGMALVSRLIEEARQAGYARLRLDSARFMREAHSLYRRAGFSEITAYPGSEIPPEFQPHWIFMERSL